MTNYNYIPSNIHHYGINNINSFTSDPEFYSLWSGYDPSKLGKTYDPMYLYSKLREEGRDLGSTLTSCVDRTYIAWPHSQNTNFCDIWPWEIAAEEGLDFEDKFFQSLSFVRNQMTSKKFKAQTDPSYDLSSLYEDYYRVPTEEHFKASQDMAKKTNYYCLLHAIYDVGKRQADTNFNNPLLTSEYPITMNMYPKEMRDMVIALSQKMYGEQSISTTTGQDYDFASFTDNLGRGEVMMFYDTDELLVPTSHEMFCYESNIRTIMSKNPNEFSLREAERDISQRDYDGNGIGFTDSTYGMRVIMAAIKSIEDNQIQSQNENVAFHRMSDIIKKYPVLTEIAQDKKIFFEKLDELSIICKTIQSEYDARNFKRAALRKTDAFAHSFVTANFFLKYASSTPEKFLMESLTDEEKQIYDSVIGKTGVTATIDVVDTIGTKVSGIDKNWMEKLCSIANKKIDGISTKSTLFEGIDTLSKSNLFDQFYPMALKNVPIDFDQIKNSQHAETLLFLRDLLSLESLDPMTIADLIVKGIEITPENEHSIEMLRATVIKDVFDYNMAQMKDKDNSNYTYNAIIQKLFVTKLVSSNPQIMRNTNKVQNTVEVPLLYSDLTPMVDYCHKEIQTALIEGKSSDECLDEVIDKLNQQDEDQKLPIITSPRKANDSLTDFIDFTLQISKNDNQTREALVERQKKIDFYLQSVVPNDTKREEISKVWSWYGPELLKNQSPRLLSLLIADYEIARSELVPSKKNTEDLTMESGVKK